MSVSGGYTQVASPALAEPTGAHSVAVPETDGRKAGGGAVGGVKRGQTPGCTAQVPGVALPFAGCVTLDA